MCFETFSSGKQLLTTFPWAELGFLLSTCGFMSIKTPFWGHFSATIGICACVPLCSCVGLLVSSQSISVPKVLLQTWHTFSPSLALLTLKGLEPGGIWEEPPSSEPPVPPVEGSWPCNNWSSKSWTCCRASFGTLTVVLSEVEGGGTGRTGPGTGAGAGLAYFLLNWGVGSSSSVSSSDESPMSVR